MDNNLTSRQFWINYWESFKYQSKKQCDIVLSNGLIEHFEGTALIVQKHSIVITATK